MKKIFDNWMVITAALVGVVVIPIGLEAVWDDIFLPKFWIKKDVTCQFEYWVDENATVYGCEGELTIMNKRYTHDRIMHCYGFDCKTLAECTKQVQDKLEKAMPLAREALEYYKEK